MDSEIKLSGGWKKQLVFRKSGASTGGSDVYIHSPKGQKLRSRPDLLTYLSRNPELLGERRESFW